MRNRYDNSPSKDARMANVRQGRLEAEHMAKNAFVKRVQAAQAKHAGKAPDLKEEAMHFDAYMCNNGEHAVKLGEKITAGLDKVAFPVK